MHEHGIEAAAMGFLLDLALHLVLDIYGDVQCVTEVAAYHRTLDFM